jgi:hypothetical protein
LIFLALHVEQPVRLFLCVRRPTLAYTGGCRMDGFKTLLPGPVGGEGVEVVCWTGDAETGDSDDGTGSDMAEGAPTGRPGLS